MLPLGALRCCPDEGNKMFGAAIGAWKNVGILLVACRLNANILFGMNLSLRS
jgi:hypothetical protein